VHSLGVAEEWRLANKDILKRQPLIFILPIISVILVVYLYSMTFSSSNNITAQEAKVIADEVAFSYNNSAQLYYVSSQQDMINHDNSCNEWRFHYIVGYYNSNAGYEFLQVSVDSDGTYTESTGSEDDADLMNKTFNNWIIDENQAFNIALDNDDVGLYLKSHDSKVFLYWLTVDENQSTNPVWKICWRDSSNEKMWVVIDSHEGNVIETRFEPATP
jgi:uncharacterized protein YqkB